MQDALLAANVGGDNVQTNLGQGFDTTITVTKSGTEEDVNITDFDSSADMPHADPQEYVSDALASSAEEDAIDDLVSAQLVCESDSMVTDESAKPYDDIASSAPAKKKKKQNEHSDEDLSEYDPTKAVGRC